MQILRNGRSMIADFQLLEILTRHGVPLVVIGGHAVVFQGWVSMIAVG